MERAVLLLLSVSLASAQFGAKLGRKFDADVTRAARDWEVPGLAIAVVKDDEIVFAQGYGVRERGVDGEVDENTLFAIGSTTKAMTAALLGTLVEIVRAGGRASSVSRLAFLFCGPGRPRRCRE